MRGGWVKGAEVTGRGYGARLRTESGREEEGACGEGAASQFGTLDAGLRDYGTRSVRLGVAVVGWRVSSLVSLGACVFPGGMTSTCGPGTHILKKDGIVCHRSVDGRCQRWGEGDKLALDGGVNFIQKHKR